MSDSLSTTLTPVQLKALDLLVEGNSVTEAARRLGLHRTTIHHWRRECPEFQAMLDHLQQLRLESLAFDAAELHSAAFDALSDLLTNNHSASVRLQAVQTVLRVLPSTKIHHNSSLSSLPEVNEKETGTYEG